MRVDEKVIGLVTSMIKCHENGDVGRQTRSDE